MRHYCTLVAFASVVGGCSASNTKHLEEKGIAGGKSCGIGGELATGGVAGSSGGSFGAATGGVVSGGTAGNIAGGSASTGGTAGSPAGGGVVAGGAATGGTNTGGIIGAGALTGGYPGGGTTGGGMAGGGTCTVTAVAGRCGISAPPPPPDAFLVEDFERGPLTGNVYVDDCFMPGFLKLKPSGSGGSKACDMLGVNSSSCKSMYFCNGTLGGICPEYIGCEKGAWRGEYSLRLHYDITQGLDAFAGIILDIANTAKDTSVCLVNRAPVNLSAFEYLSMRVRASDGSGNAEIALQDKDIVQTNPKVVLVPDVQAFLPKGEWTPIKIKVCDLLRHQVDGDGFSYLGRDAIAQVLLGFAQRRFVNAFTYTEGKHWLDIDDIVFESCSNSTCPSCQ